MRISDNLHPGCGSVELLPQRAMLYQVMVIGVRDSKRREPVGPRQLHWHRRGRHNALANGAGVDVRSSDNLIGGTTVAARNVIGANDTCITINPSTGNRIQGNFIGTDVTGTNSFALGDLIQTNGAAQIGGLTVTPGTPPGNVISGGEAGGGCGHGIVVSNGVSNNVIQGNLIGTDATGTQPLGNGLDGVQIFGASNMSAAPT